MDRDGLSANDPNQTQASHPARSGIFAARRCDVSSTQRCVATRKYLELANRQAEVKTEIVVLGHAIGVVGEPASLLHQCEVDGLPLCTTHN
jgi:hypothetical protein